MLCRLAIQISRSDFVAFIVEEAGTLVQLAASCQEPFAFSSSLSSSRATCEAVASATSEVFQPSRNSRRFHFQRPSRLSFPPREARFLVQLSASCQAAFVPQGPEPDRARNNTFARDSSRLYRFHLLSAWRSALDFTPDRHEGCREERSTASQAQQLQPFCPAPSLRPEGRQLHQPRPVLPTPDRLNQQQMNAMYSADLLVSSKPSAPHCYIT